MSTFIKNSPLGSPPTGYGQYGSANVNPYASYFGSQQHQPLQVSLSSPPVAPSGGASFLGQSSTGVSYTTFGNMNNNSSFNSISMPQQPSSMSSFINPNSFGAATSPFTSPGQGQFAGAQSGGQHFVPYPPQTRIIGGVHSPNNSSNNPNANANSGRWSNFGGAQQIQQGQGASPRNYQTYTVHSSPVRSEDMLEPMHTSPIQSGFGLGLHNPSPPGNTIMLPSYLLGLDNHNHQHHQAGGSPPTSGGANSPSIMGGRGGSSFNEYGQSGGGYRRAFLLESSLSGRVGVEGEQPEAGSIAELKAQNKTGPPKHGFGSSDGITAAEFLQSPLIKSPLESSNTNTVDRNAFSSSMIPGSASPMDQHTPPSTPAASATSNWVTVFGFPAAASSFILSNFSTFGKIMEVKSTPGSNWLHIRFSDRIEAKRALAKNGKVLGGSIMVGVVNSDLNVVEKAEKARTELGNSASQSSNPSVSTSSSSTRTAIPMRDTREDVGSIKSRIRPLATGSIPCSPSFYSKQNPRILSQLPSRGRRALEVDGSPAGSGLLPSSSNGMFTKAMEFMFGW